MPRKAVTKKKTAKKRASKPKDTSKLVHFLVPVHIKLSQKEKDELLKKYNVTLKELPKIFINDPAIRHLDIKDNDIIKIKRASPTAGTTVFYRGVIRE